MQTSGTGLSVKNALNFFVDTDFGGNYNKFQTLIYFIMSYFLLLDLVLNCYIKYVTVMSVNFIKMFFVYISSLINYFNLKTFEREFFITH